MPTTLNEILQHELQIARLATGEINSAVLPALRNTYLEIRRLLRERDFPNTPKRLEMMERAIAEIITRNAGWVTVTQALDDFALYEAGVALGITQQFTARQLALPAEQKILDFVRNALMSLESRGRAQTGIWPQFVQQNIDSRINVVNNIIRTAYARSQTLRVVGTNIRNAFEGLLKRESEALARTGFAHYANQSRVAMGENLRIDADWVLIFTFDSRISQRCLFQSQTRDRWPVNDPQREIPPLHFNCRTTGVILPRGEELSGLRPAVGGKSGKRAEKSFDRRSETKTPKYRGRKDPAFEAERVRASTDYADFLRAQPAWFIDSVLGATKGRAFRSGKYELRQFFDMTGRPLTLAELRQIDARVFG